METTALRNMIEKLTAKIAYAGKAQTVAADAGDHGVAMAHNFHRGQYEAMRDELRGMLLDAEMDAAA